VHEFCLKMHLFILSALVAVAFAVPPQWYNGPCGISKYADAGNQPLPPFKIVGGIEARAHEFPWQISLRTTSNSHYCGGSIINANWIVTAAHCMDGDTPAQVRVVTGDHTRNDASNTVRQTHNAAQIVMHPDYDSRTFENDIALVRVQSTIAFNIDVQPVCGPEQTDNFQYRLSYCSGWGTTSSGGSCCPQTLRYVSLNITTNAFCDAAYTSDTISADMICASDNIGGTERDSCQGDSGGPLVVKDANGQFSLAGVVSWGIGCASSYPGVYSRVSHFHDWILQVINA